MNGKSVMIGYNRRDPKSVRIAEEICAELTASGFAPLSLKYDDGGTGGLKGAKSSESGEGCVCMITVGGDGSIISHGDIKRIPEIITGNFRVSRRMMMSVDVSYANGGKLHQNCLNDVVVSRDSKSKLPEFCVYCGETEVSRLRADGVIFSTPTGSTAYSLSAGGPIIDPALHCIEYTALCPHSLFSRPMIFSAEREVTLRVNSYQDSRVTINFDGDSGYPFDEGDVLTLHIGSPDLMLIETGEGFFGSVNRKLMQPLR